MLVQKIILNYFFLHFAIDLQKRVFVFFAVTL